MHVKELSGALFVLSEIFVVEVRKLVEGYHLVFPAVVKVGMRSSGNNEEFLVSGVLAVFGHVCERVLAEVAGMGFVSVNDEDGASYLV